MSATQEEPYIHPKIHNNSRSAEERHLPEENIDAIISAQPVTSPPSKPPPIPPSRPPPYRQNASSQSPYSNYATIPSHDDAGTSYRDQPHTSESCDESDESDLLLGDCNQPIAKTSWKGLNCNRIACIFLVTSCVIAIIVGFAVWLFSSHCKHKCGDGMCLTSAAAFCDGIRQCKDGGDERNCQPKFIELPSDNIASVGEDVIFNCKAVIGVDILEWYYTNSDEETVIWDSADETYYAPGYHVSHMDDSNRYDLVIDHIKGSQGWLTFGVRFRKTVQQHEVRVTVTDDFKCMPESSQLDIFESDVMNLTASINYYGITSPPIHWYFHNEKLPTDNRLIDYHNYTTIEVSFRASATAQLDNTRYEAYAFQTLNADPTKPPYLGTCRIVLRVLRFLELPSDQITLVGDDVMLNCKAIVGTHVIEWYFKDADNETIIWDSASREYYIPGYHVSHVDNSDSYDLTIKDIAGQQGWLIFGVRFQKTTHLHETRVTVTDDFKCFPGSSQIDIVEGDVMNLTASINYYGITTPPIHWYNHNEQLSTDDKLIHYSNFTTTEVSYSRSAIVQLDNTRYQAYAFQTLNADPTTSPYLGTCRKSVSVLYEVRNVSIKYNIGQRYCSSRDIVLDGGSVLTCHASGNPKPSFTWKCDDGASSYNSILRLNFHKNMKVSCTCTAKNEVQSKTYEETKTLKFRICDKPVSGASVHSSFGIVQLLLLTTFIKTMQSNTDDRRQNNL